MQTLWLSLHLRDDYLPHQLGSLCVAHVQNFDGKKDHLDVFSVNKVGQQRCADDNSPIIEKVSGCLTSLTILFALLHTQSLKMLSKLAVQKCNSNAVPSNLLASITVFLVVFFCASETFSKPTNNTRTKHTFNKSPTKHTGSVLHL